MFTDKKIDIKAYNVKNFVDKFGDISIQNFCNVMLEKIFDGKIIELTDENTVDVKKCAESINKDISFVINSLLEKFELVPLVKTEKTKIEISPSKPVLKARSKVAVNKVFNW